MKKHIFIFLVLNIIASTTSFAQRLNARGEKLVKSVSVHWYDEDGTFKKSISSDYSFDYDETGVLIGMARKFKDGKDVFTENFKKENKRIICTVLKNGKTIPNYNLELGLSLALHKREIIEFRKEVYPVYDDDGSIFSTDMLVTWYKNGCIDVRAFYLTDVEGNAENIKEYGDKNVDMDERKWGLGKLYSVYLSKDDKIIEIDDTNTQEWAISSWKGDLYPRRITSDEDISIMQIGTKYSDKINDTNINFYGFSDHYSNTPFRNAELLTEWSRYRSKHLVLKEDYNKKLWEYTYDVNNNISEIKIVDKYYFNQYCIVKLEYMY